MKINAFFQGALLWAKGKKPSDTIVSNQKGLNKPKNHLTQYLLSNIYTVSEAKRGQ
jgi:hypothetical protein